jgi:competence protein ComEC
VSAPSLVPAALFIAGLTLGTLIPLPAWSTPAALAAACLTAAVGVVRGGVGATLALAAGFLAAGVVAGGAAEVRAGEPPLREQFDRFIDRGQTPPVPVEVEGLLMRDASPNQYGATLDLDVRLVWIDGVVHRSAGGLRLGVGGRFVPAHMGAWRAGRRVRATATLRRAQRFLNPGVPDHERALARSGICLLGSVKSASLVEVLAPGTLPQELAARARDRVRRSLARSVGGWSAQSAAMAIAVLIGDRAGLSEEVERRLQAAGTYHVIAISGGNIAVLAALVFGLCRLTGAAPRTSAAVGILLVGAYAYIVGGGPSVVRASIVAGLYLAARLVDHRTAVLNAVGVAALAMAALAPQTIFDPGFALSFAATIAIVVGAPAWSSALQHFAARCLPDWVSRALRPACHLFAATLCAELALMPVTAYAFSQVTFAGLLLNFLAIPLMTVVQVGGLLAFLVDLWWAELAVAAGWVPHAAASALVGSAEWTRLFPWAAFRLAPPPGPILTLYFGCVIAALLTREHRLRVGLGTAAGLTLIWILSGSPMPRGASETGGLLRVTFFDVGQGDAALVRLPGGAALLVDAGGTLGTGFDIGERILTPALWAQGLRRLDAFAATHGDPDHLGGALAVMRGLTPVEVWDGFPVSGHAGLSLLQAEARARGVRWHRLNAGRAFTLSGARLLVHHPPEPDWERPRVRNDDSLVLEVVFERVSILFTGDIGREGEAAVAPRLSAAPLRVVKVPHHGSRSSSTPEFIAAARPRAAVVSAGRGNGYGHPVPEVLARYRAAGAAIYRTDLDGAVSVESTGRDVTITTRTGRVETLRLP